MRLLIVFLLLLSLACTLPGIATPTRSQPVTPAIATATATQPLPPTPTPQPLPPALIESAPPQGMEIPLAGPVTLYFNQAMDRASVENAMNTPSGLKFSWVDDQTVAIFPNAALQPGSELTVNLDTQARSQQGLGLLQPIRLNYRAAGYLRQAQVLPTPGATDVDPTSAIVASFTRPVVALGADPAALPPAFTLTPAAQGRSEWLNTSTYIFYPEPGLAGGVQYAVSPNPSLTSVDGSPLEAAQPWSFTTALPRLLSIDPSTETAWRLDTPIKLTFNQPMNPTSVEASFALLGPDKQPVAGKSAWNTDNTIFTFTPAAQLARSSLYVLRLDGGAQGRGGATLGKEQKIQVATFGALSIYRSEPPPGGQIEPSDSLSLYLSAPLKDFPNAEDILQYITLTPAAPNLRVYYDDTYLRLRLLGDFSASAAYTVQVSPNLPDAWGATLGQPYSLSFQTGPLPTSLRLLASSAATFITPQNTAGAGTSIPVLAANAFYVPITAGSVSLQDFITMLGSGGYELRQSYRSADQQGWYESLDIPPDVYQTTQLYLREDHGTLAPGLYFMRFGYTDPRINNGPHLIIVSNLQITFKVGANEVLVWATDLRSGAPAANTPVTIYSESGDVIATGQTDAQGLFHTGYEPLKDPYATLYALLGQPGQDNFSLALSSWSQGIAPWEFNARFDLEAPALQTYIYTDRPIYRPGQTVYFRAVIRQAFNGRYTLPDRASLPFAVYDETSQELAHFDLPISAYGAAHGEFTLPEAAQPGYYSISCPDLPNASGVGFKVADYRKPEINLQVGFSQTEAHSGDNLHAEVNARYFFDAPAGNLPVQWTLYAASSAFYLPGYQVGIEDTSWLDAYHMPDFGGQLYGKPVAEGQARTNPQGLLNLELPTPVALERMEYTLEVTIQDESGRPVSARASLPVHPSDFYIGVRPDAWVGRAAQAANFTIQFAGWDQQPAGEHRLRAEFSKITWQRQDPSANAGMPEYALPTLVPTYTLVGSADFATSAAGQARLSFTPTEPGAYQLAIYDPQLSAGKPPRTEFTLWVSGPGRAAWPNLPNARLRLTADQATYQPGSQAQVFIPNPFGQDVQALLTIERAAIFSLQTLNIPAEGYTLQLPLAAEHAPNIYVSVTLLGQNAQGQPDFRYGLLNLPVAPLQQTLNVALASQPQRAGPGDTVTFDVLVTDAAGQPVQGEFSLAVVDLAVLALSDPNAPDILPAFYAQQPIGIRTGLSLAAYAQRITYAPMGLGGGGGGDVPSVVRQNFPDTAYWNAEIVTGPDGKAQVSIQLPDTLTTWQVDLRGLTADTRVGQAQTQLITSKDLLIRPVTPRFLVVGDRVQLAAIAQNTTANAINAEVSLQSNGLALESPVTQQVSISANGRVRVEWWAVAQDAAEAELVFTIHGQDAAGGSYQDSASPDLGPALPIERYFARQAFRTSGILDAGGQLTELLSLPRTFDPQSGELKVELAPSLAASMLGALEVLEHTPYESSEQMVSRFLPNLETYRVLQQNGIVSPILQARLERTLLTSLQRLWASQNYDGGWGWQQGGASDAYITSYVLLGLLHARESGAQVSAERIQAVVDYLNGSASQPTPLFASGSAALYSPTPLYPALLYLTPLPGGGGLRPASLDRQVFQEFVLSEAKAPNPEKLSSLYQSKEKLEPWGKALLALALENVTPGNADARNLLSDLQTTAVRSATGAHWELAQTPESRLAAQYNMQTTLSNSAIVIYALAQRDPGSPLLGDAMRYLMAHRQADGAWGASYTTAWTLMAANRIIAGTGELGGSFAYSAALNGAPLVEGNAGGSDQLTPISAQIPVKRLYADYPNSLVLQRAQGPGRLYYAVTLNVSRPVQNVASLSQGLNIARAFFSTSDSPQAIQNAQAGQKVNVRLTLTLPQEMYYLVVEDYIPAGAELLDPGLKTSQLGAGLEPSAETIYDPRNPFARGWGWWLFNTPRLYDDHITWTADYLAAGSYELSYTLVLVQPGQFQVLPAQAWQLYFPEVQANSAGALFEITP